MKILKKLTINSVLVVHLVSRYLLQGYPLYNLVVSYKMISDTGWGGFPRSISNIMYRLNSNRWHILETLSKYV